MWSDYYDSDSDGYYYCDDSDDYYGRGRRNQQARYQTFGAKPCPNGRLHEAIKSGKYEEVKRLIDQGARPCYLSGGNTCFRIESGFKSWELKKLLLQHEPRGVNLDSFFSGQTAIMRFGHIAENARYLLDLGANVNAEDDDGKSVMEYICSNSEVQYDAVQMIINRGAKFDAKILTLVIMNLLSSEHNREEKLKIIKNFINNSSIDRNYQFNSDLHPQILVLKENIKNNFSEVAIVELFEFILKSPFGNLKWTKTYSGDVLGTISFAIQEKCTRNMELSILKDIVSKLLAYGFTCNDSNAVSPITTFLKSITSNWQLLKDLRLKNDINSIKFTDTEENSENLQQDNSLVDFIQYLQENGAKVCAVDERLPSVKAAKTLQVPIALEMAVKYGLWRVVRYLLPYWGYPPLALLPLLGESRSSYYDDSSSSYDTKNKIYVLLAQEGGIPGHTPVFTQTIFHIRFKLPQCVKEHFLKFHSSPLSLMELCRYEIRKNIIPRSLQAGPDLPELIESISPPGLKQFLLMKPPQDLGVCVCDIQELETLNEQSASSPARSVSPDWYEYED